LIDAKPGLKAFFISKEDLIAAKLASGRIRGLADVENIRAASFSVEAAVHQNKAFEPAESGTGQ
jgi:hypothetical protein